MIVIISSALVFGSLLVFAWQAQKALTNARVAPGTPNLDEDSSSHRTQVLLAMLFYALSVAAFSFFTHAKSPSTWSLVPTMTFGVVFFPVMALSVRDWRKSFDRVIAHAPGVYVAGCWLVLLNLLAITSPANTSTIPLVGAGVIGGLALFLLGTRLVAGNASRYPLLLALAALVIWIPIEFDLVQAFRLGNPPAQFDISRVLIYVFGLTLFLVVGKIPRIGYSFVLRWVDLSKAFIGLIAFAAVAIPLALTIGFIVWEPEALNIPVWLVRAIYIYFCIAIPEELLFRGVIQNMLERHWPGAYGRSRSAMLGSIVYAAVIFGIAHINNQPAPNWPYVLLSSLAGIAYGWVWQRTRRITASALTHTAVDWLWVTLFR